MIMLSWAVPYTTTEEDSITRSFYLKSSFFGLEGQENVPAEFSIVPNPNNGEMELFFENLTGKICVKVYDMHGTLVDNIETYNDLNSNTLHYTLKQNTSGIFFFIATASEDTITKKVIIE